MFSWSGGKIPSGEMRIFDMETLSGFASGRSQEQHLPNNGALVDTLSTPPYHTHTLFHLFSIYFVIWKLAEIQSRLLDLGRVLGDGSRIDAAG